MATTVRLGALTAVALGLCACGGGGGGAERVAAAPVAEEPQAGIQEGGMQLMRETYSATRNGIGDAVTAPLRDFNVVRRDIPEILTIAQRDPYAVPERLDCAGLQYDISRYDLVLGPDLDVPGDATDRSLYARGAEAASNAALDAVRDATTGWIPFRSVIRRLTGAEQGERDFRAAVLAGTIRRAYLKGLGEAHGCRMPAAPLRLARSTPAEPTPASVAAPAASAPAATTPASAAAPGTSVGSSPAVPQR